MRQVILGVVLLFCAVSGRAIRKPLYTAVVLAMEGYFAGWSRDYNSGRIPSAFQLRRIHGTQVINLPATADTGPRPDAAACLGSTCGRPFDSDSEALKCGP
jgi:hypothetical protein